MDERLLAKSKLSLETHRPQWVSFVSIFLRWNHKKGGDENEG